MVKRAVENTLASDDSNTTLAFVIKIVWRELVMQNVVKKKIFLVIVVSILSLCLITTDSNVTASNMTAEVVSQTSLEKNLNPNQIKEIQYFLKYDSTGEITANRQLAENEHIDNIELQAKEGGVIYTVALVPVEGQGKIDIVFTINGFIGSKPNRIDVDFGLYRGVERGTAGTSVKSCSTIIQGILNVKVGKQVACTSSITKTGFYFGEVNLTTKNILGIATGTDTAQTSQVLTNKIAVAYPWYIDPWSGKVMTEPAKADWAKTSSIDWTTNDRAKYIKEYSELYPNNGWNWTGSVTHIHHIRPREYGGTNDFNNLIPIPATVHVNTVSPWFRNY